MLAGAMALFLVLVLVLTWMLPVGWWPIPVAFVLVLWAIFLPRLR